MKTKWDNVLGKFSSVCLKTLWCLWFFNNHGLRLSFLSLVCLPCCLCFCCSMGMFLCLSDLEHCSNLIMMSGLIGVQWPWGSEMVRKNLPDKGCIVKSMQVHNEMVQEVSCRSCIWRCSAKGWQCPIWQSCWTENLNWTNFKDVISLLCRWKIIILIPLSLL